MIKPWLASKNDYDEILLSWRGQARFLSIVKTLYPLVRLFLLVTIIPTSLAFAAAPAKPAPKAPAKPATKPAVKPQSKPMPNPTGQAEILKKYDLDRSKSLNVTEARTIQEAYAANPQDAVLKKYDTDKNGKISDAEVMKIIPPPPAPPKPKAAPKKPKKKK